MPTHPYIQPTRPRPQATRLPICRQTSQLCATCARSASAATSWQSCLRKYVACCSWSGWRHKITCCRLCQRASQSEQAAAQFATPGVPAHQIAFAHQELRSQNTTSKIEKKLKTLKHTIITRLVHLKLLNLDGNPLGGRLVEGGPTLLQVRTQAPGCILRCISEPALQARLHAWLAVTY